MLDKLKHYPMFFVVGIEFIFEGIFFIFQNHYFKWPPVFVNFENNDIFGTLFVLLGFALILVKMFHHKLKYIEPLIMFGCAFIQTFLTFVEAMHYFRLGINMPWIPNLGIDMIIIVLATRSDIR